MNKNEVVVKNDKGKVDLSQYTEDEIQKYKSMTSDLSVKDNNSILDYGSNLQKKLSEYSDDFLNNIKSFDAGEIGESINDLLNEISYANPDNNNNGFVKKMLLKVPGVKKMVKKSDKYLKKYEAVSGNIDNITTQMDKSRADIIRDNAKLSDLLDKNHNFVGDLEDYIISGHIKLDELNAELEELENDADVDPFLIEEKKEFISRLSKRVHDMELTRVITVQSLPQIKMVQNNNNTMVEKIQSSINSTIPVWKNQVALAVTMKRQGQIAQVQEKIYDTTNEILTKNSDKLKENSISIAKQNERGIVSTEAIKEVSNNLISTLDEINKIKEDGQKVRNQVENELKTIEEGLKKAIINDKV